VVVGTAIQAAGIGAQALFHLSGGRLPWLTERRTSVIDHTLSNAGVLCLAWQGVRWTRSGAVRVHAGRRLVAVGAGVEGAGAVADGVGHLLGGEHRLSLFAIAAGYVTVLTGVALSVLRPARGRKSRSAR
jgi:hypothetical protein